MTAIADALPPEYRELVASLRRRLETGARHEKEVLTHFVLLALRDCALEELRAEVARARAPKDPAERWSRWP